ncbi:MAG: sulfatase-like hydrolase/transferase [Planctomycetota bacterium]|jgi:arylsulfatase
MNRRGFLKVVGLGAAGVVLPGCGGVFDGRSGVSGERPNVVLIVADDIGFSDIGCYGSEVETPNLDMLGAKGVRFTQFYNMAKCNPTRSSLFTGQYLPTKDSENVQVFPKLLGDGGYYTAMCGKEHFDKWVPKRCYAENCFEDSFVYWAINSYFVPPKGKFENSFKLNGKQVEIKDLLVEKQPLYKTDVVTNYALKFLDKAKAKNKPFFLYLPYHSAHYPLQARKEDIAKYRGKYKKGWDVVRKERFAKQKQLGVISKDCKLSPPEGNINKHRGPYRKDIYKYRPWDTVGKKEQDELDLEMAVFAAMIDCMDQNIARVIAKLKEMDALDNTLIMFFSDNGSCPYDSNKDFSVPPGGANSYRSLCAAWANVGDTPFRYYKQYGHEGGSRTHFIAHWPKVIKPGLCKLPAHLVDIYPTMLELAGKAYPKSAQGKKTPDLDGSSLVPLLQGKQRQTPEIIISGHGEKMRMVRIGDYKIVTVNAGPWQLYNIAEDPTELNNLASKKPEKLAELKNAYAAWKQKNGVEQKRKQKKT